VAGGDVFWVTFAGAFVVEVFVWFGAGDFAPEDEHAATSRPPATTIDSDRSNLFIWVLTLFLDETLSLPRAFPTVLNTGTEPISFT
jgi:hypothetical protein